MESNAAIRMLEQMPVPVETETKKSPSQTQVLLDLCSGVELFHTPDLEAFATVPTNGHEETWLLRSQGFKNWLRREYFVKTASAPCTQSMQDAIATLEGQAQFAGAVHEVHLRLAQANENIYVDLCNDNWSVVEISKAGWNVLSKSPIKFRRAKGMSALPTPLMSDSAESIRKLQSYMNLESEGDFKLAMAWLMSALNPQGPFPTLVLYGEQGSGKSTLVRLLRDLVDPNISPLRREPRNSDDLMVSARSNWVVAVDNMSFMPDWLSDDLCRLATGGGLSKRQHYSDDEEVVLDAKRPIIINGIDEFVTRGDLASRAIMLNLPNIEEHSRNREEVYWRQFEGEKASIFGGICSALSNGLRTKATFELKRLPRMADAWHWVTAVETAFGWERGQSLRAFEQNQIKANEIVLSSSPLFPALRQLAEEGFEGNAELLLTRIQMNADKSVERRLPTSARSLSDKIRRLAPALRSAGIEVTMEKTPGSNSKRMIILRKSSKNIDATDAFDAQAARQSLICDGRDDSDDLKPRVSNEEALNVGQ